MYLNSYNSFNNKAFCFTEGFVVLGMSVKLGLMIHNI